MSLQHRKGRPGVRRGLLAAALTLGLVMVSTPGAHADESSQIAEIVRLNPGSTAKEVRAEVAAMAKAQQTTPAAVRAAVLKEARASVQTTTVAARSSSSGGGSKALGAARNVGDVFYTPSSTAGVNHGHSGLYASKTVVVEAPGTGKVVRRIAATSVRVVSGAKKQSVSTTAAKRKASGTWALKKLGKPYNNVFFNNKKIEASKYNCSQLVWAAYKRLSVDLDSNGGAGVYPGNIRDSKHTSTYANL